MERSAGIGESQVFLAVPNEGSPIGRNHAIAERRANHALVGDARSQAVATAAERSQIETCI